MNYVKKMIKSYFYMIGSILVLTFIVTLFNYFDIINNAVLNVLSFIIPLIGSVLGGFIIGKNALKNGWLEGLKIAIIFVFIIFIFNLIFIHNVNMKDVIFYILMVISSVLGSMLGINKK